MIRPILILRPQPGADATARRAADRGLEAIVVPLFRIVPKDWAMPEKPFDALLVTSANAARLLDDRLDRETPVFAVGSATADALFRAGFRHVTVGEGSVSKVVSDAACAGVRVLLHLAGEDRTAFDPGDIHVETRIVYASEAVEPEPDLTAALERGAVALLHSARAAERFRSLAGAGHRIAAISPAVRAAAGEGWEQAIVAERPEDDALLAAAARLCQ